MESPRAADLSGVRLGSTSSDCVLSQGQNESFFGSFASPPHNIGHESNALYAAEDSKTNMCGHYISDSSDFEECLSDCQAGGLCWSNATMDTHLEDFLQPSECEYEPFMELAEYSEQQSSDNFDYSTPISPSDDAEYFFPDGSLSLDNGSAMPRLYSHLQDTPTMEWATTVGPSRAGEEGSPSFPSFHLSPPNTSDVGGEIGYGITSTDQIRVGKYSALQDDEYLNMNDQIICQEDPNAGQVNQAYQMNAFNSPPSYSGDSALLDEGIENPPTEAASEESPKISPFSQADFQDYSLHHTTEARRKYVEDLFILECREKGLSYKEIRARGGFVLAESTLRGRFRSLVKERHERVRKPKWTSADIKLLKQYIQQESGENWKRDKVKTIEQLNALGVSWKEAGKYIYQNGGTYNFGPSTCKKKWIEVSGIRDSA